MMEVGDEVGRFVYFWVTHGLVDNGTHAPRFPIEKGRTTPPLKNSFDRVQAIRVY